MSANESSEQSAENLWEGRTQILHLRYPGPFKLTKWHNLEFLTDFVYASGTNCLYTLSLYYLLIRMGIMHNLLPVPLTSEGAAL